MNPALDFVRRLAVDPAGVERDGQTLTNDEWNDNVGSVTAALTLAAERRFPSQDYGEVVRWVADVRARAGDWAADLDPTASERIIGAVVSDDGPSTDDISADQFAAVALRVLPELLRDLELSEPDLDALLVEAETLAQQWRRGG